MINNWQSIATSLAEPPRERKLQEQKFFEISQTSYRLWGFALDIPPVGSAARQKVELGSRSQSGINGASLRASLHLFRLLS
jgi:hypothetical protein